MTDTRTDPEAPPPMGIVEHLVREDGERKKFLKMVGGASAASFGAFVLAACGSSSSSKSASTSSSAPAASSTTSAGGSSSSGSGGGGGDLAIANYALTLEYLETAFYQHVVKSGLFSGKTGALISSFAHQEATHVRALKSLIKAKGGTPVAKPKSKFPIQSASQVAQLAYTVENLGAGAYLGQAAKITDAEVLAAALSIHSVEARHAAALGTLVGKSVTPDGAFGKPADMPTVLAAVKPFLA